MTIERWMIKADRDLLTARTMIQLDDAPLDIVCFHSQQCAEKSLKAFLVLADHDFPKTHDLPKLLKMCIGHDEEFSALEEAAGFLADYAVETRYVDDWRDIPVDEATEAVRKGENILVFVRGQLGSGDRNE